MKGHVQKGVVKKTKTGSEELQPGNETSAEQVPGCVQERNICQLGRALFEPF